MTEPIQLSIISIEDVSPWTALCVVRCLAGPVYTGMTLRVTSLPEDMDFEVVEIEWYGRKIDTLDAIHSAKVLLSGSGTRLLQSGDSLAG
ncbi:hypothetical protein [Streptomyces sp. CAU 1734]|uniref:hypothetical protein n=1 Tax=Streptomyces sp. CAU 1734 TaxID=3140360 RepID=UPI0032603711